MILSHEQLSRKYAAAFLNVFIKQMTVDDARALYRAHVYFSTGRTFFFFLGLPTISLDKKHELIDVLFEKLKLFSPLKRLLDLLIKQKRVILFNLVLKHIWRQYLLSTDRDYVRIASSHALSKDAQQIIVEFLARLSGKDIMYEYAQDKDLIAGIRLQSNNLLWERSIRKQLRTIRQSCNA